MDFILESSQAKPRQAKKNQAQLRSVYIDEFPFFAVYLCVNEADRFRKQTITDFSLINILDEFIWESN